MRRGHRKALWLGRRWLSTGWVSPAPHSKGSVPWESKERRMKFLEHLETAHGVKEAGQWRHVPKKAIVGSEEGRTWLQWYGGSLHAALQDLRPELEAKAFHCSHRLPGDYWKNVEHRREFLVALAHCCGVSTRRDWEKVTVRHVRDMGGSGLLTECGSLHNALQQTFPSAHPYPTARRGKEHWSNAANRRAFLEKLAHASDVQELSDWKRVTYDNVVEAGGAGLLALYGNSVFAMLKDNLGIEELSVNQCRSKVPQRHWECPENRRALLEEVGAKLGVRDARGWASVSPAVFRAHGGGTLLARYGQSMMRMLEDILGGDEGWRAFLARPVLPKEYWDSPENVRAFLEHARDVLCILHEREWSRVSREEIRSVPGGGSFLHNKLSLREALETAYPQEDWETHFTEMGATKKSTQRVMKLCLQQLFPGMDVMEDFYHSVLATGTKGKGLELDVFLPDLRLAVEFNGEHHYEELPFFAPLEVTQLRDSEKRRLCEQAGIRLVTVPYWWNKSLPELAATIHAYYPGLLRNALDAQQHCQQQL